VKSIWDLFEKAKKEKEEKVNQEDDFDLSLTLSSTYIPSDVLDQIRKNPREVPVTRNGEDLYSKPYYLF